MPDMGLKEARRILGVSANTGSKKIKSRFRELVSKHHPDHGGDVKMFKRIATAYSTITNWNGTDIVARKVEDWIFDSMWNEWLRKLSLEDQNKVAEDLKRIKQKG